MLLKKFKRKVQAKGAAGIFGHENSQQQYFHYNRIKGKKTVLKSNSILFNCHFYDDLNKLKVLLHVFYDNKSQFFLSFIVLNTFQQFWVELLLVFITMFFTLQTYSTSESPIGYQGLAIGYFDGQNNSCTLCLHFSNNNKACLQLNHYQYILSRFWI